MFALAVGVGCGDSVPRQDEPKDAALGVDAANDAANGDGGQTRRDAAIDGPLDAAVGPRDAAIDGPVDAAIDAPIDAAIDAMPPDAGVFTAPVYGFLSETGLYEDIGSLLLAGDVAEFEPEFALWSDGADKRRWIRLPPGQTINTSDMDHWQFPVGTKIWKQFSHEVGGNTLLLETRLTEIWGPAAGQIYQASFVWNASSTDAAFTRFGATNVRGTNHDVPAVDQCIRCHRGETSRVLGFQAVQLSGAATPNIDDFAGMGWFTNQPAPGGYPVPGNAVERAAIGNMHANCGHCHNNSNIAVASNACFGLPQLQLWVKTTDQMVFDTYAYLLTVDVDLVYWTTPARGNVAGYTKRIVRGDPSNSAIYYRMGAREAGQTPPLNNGQQMPPIFTDFVDDDGLAAVEAWIVGL